MQRQTQAGSVNVSWFIQSEIKNQKIQSQVEVSKSLDKLFHQILNRVDAQNTGKGSLLERSLGGIRQDSVESTA